VPDKNNLTGHIRVVGLVSSVIAVVALGLTVLAGNRNLGRNETITQPQQIFLLLAAAVLFVVQAGLYLIFRHRQKRTIARQRRRPNEEM
jgi:ABC-type nickel/cobalt efflux system permease component RcnA